MAAISSDKVSVVFDQGYAPRHTTYLIRNFNSGDYLDASARFSIVDVGMFLVNGSTAVGSVAQTTAVSTGVVLTLAGATGVTGLLTLRGPSATGVIPPS